MSTKSPVVRVQASARLRVRVAHYRKALFSATFGLIALSLVGYALNFARDIVATSSFGLSIALDAYLLAVTIPTIIVSIIGGTIDATVIPVYLELHARDKVASERFASTLVSYAVLGTVALSALLFLLAAPAMSAIAPGLDPGRLREVEQLYVYCLPFISFSVIAYLLRSLLNAHHRFVMPALGPVVAAIVAVASVLLLTEALGVGSLVVGTVIGALLQALLLVPLAYRERVRLRPMFTFSPELKRFMVLALPLFGGMIFSTSNLIIDRFMASLLPAGRIASLNYADRIVQVIVGVLIVTVTTVALPTLSALVAKRQYAEFWAVCKRSWLRLTVIMVPCTLVLLLLGEPIIRLLFERGKFDAAATELTAQALAAYAIGLLPNALALFGVRALLALQRTRLVAMIGIINIVLNLVYNLLLIGPFGHAGIALATSLMYFTTCGLIFWLLWRAIAAHKQASRSKG